MMEDNTEISQELITYITLLSAMQVVQNCTLELEGTIYDQGRVKVKTKEALIAMTQMNDKRKRKYFQLPFLEPLVQIYLKCDLTHRLK